MVQETQWRQVALIILSGVIGAAQIGKAAIAIPLIQSDLQLSLFGVSSIVSAYALLAAVGGMVAGSVAARFPMHRVLVAGLVLIAVGNVLGLASFGIIGILGARAVEGVGFLLVAVCGPTLLRTVSSERDRPLVLGFWSAYIPVGAACMMLAGPLIMQGDWRSLWLFNAVAATLTGLVVHFVVSGSPSQPREVTERLQYDIRAVLGTRDIQLLALTFLLYTIQYFALATFLPAFLTDRLGLTLAQAGTISALALLANAAGNVVAGICLRLGISLFAIMVIAFATIGISSFGIFLGQSPAVIASIAAGLCLGVAALLPASVISTVPKYAPTQRRLALTMGLIQQCSAFGQIIGPTLIAYWAERFSWNAVPAMFSAIALLGIAVAVSLNRSGARARQNDF